jgi:hypothetical protein
LQGVVADCAGKQSNRESNVKNARAKVATGVTVVLLGGLTGVALSQGGSAPSKPVADKPIVHTKVIRRTIHVTKHAKPKHPPATAPVRPGAAGASAGGAYVATGTSGGSGVEGESASVYTGTSGGGSGTETAPVSTGSSGSETAPMSTGSSGGGESAPVATGTSGGGGSGGEVESEGGGGGGGGGEGGGDD